MKQNNSVKRLVFIAIVAALSIAVAYGYESFIGSKDPGKKGTPGITVAKDSDIVIQTKDVTETATFYPAEINGTDLEVIAVKAPDGTVRTAFNTCQVCYSSGRGYYKQEGDQLICQNCGNRFGMGDVEVARGGCNPVPITSEYKKVDAETITISKDFLTQATVIFENWSNGEQ
jgi:uncharacterized membrane protein